jgi:uncharacterized protein (TIGR03435 family)
MEIKLMVRRTLVATIAVSAFCTLVAQETFEVASIKPSDPNERRIGIGMRPGGMVNMTGVTLKLLIQQAYNVQDFQVSGAPAWAGTERYDITAKAEDSAENPDADPRKFTDAQMKTAQEKMRQRLQTLLADRFQLKVHRDTKELPVYALVVAKGGSKLQEAKVPDTPPPPPGPGRGPGPGTRGMRMSPGHLEAYMAPVSMLVQNLSQQLARTVVDQTGLKGNYDFKLSWTPDPGTGGNPFGGPGPSQGPSPGPLPPGVNPPPPPDPNGPTLFTAVQEQLGLKLESTKAPVDIIIVDHAEKASEN